MITKHLISDSHTADILTKTLSLFQFYQHMNKMGVVDIYLHLAGGVSSPTDDEIIAATKTS